MIQKMSKSIQKKIQQIINQDQWKDKTCKWTFSPNVLIHFGEIDLIDTQEKRNRPLVALSVDKPHNKPKSYEISGTHFYLDFSKCSAKFLLPIQKLIRDINDKLS